MRALVQRVTRASVEVDGEKVGEIGPGMMVLLGVKKGDTESEAEKIAAKLLKLRIFEDAEGRMNDPLGEREVLCISQFTLYGDTRKGNRPGWSEAAGGEEAEPLYDLVCEKLGASKGVFGADMKVELVNDGPVTLLVEI
ncbi:MAG: D-tyrosyl-tRNA(Tyr) deacylase [Solirubrobacterales bacterium]|jgi:D-tyrosyl-tRNA(Tyr) deacylase|nr:D-tyrosyl-tRNA(Tyr) deacylase [Solirubrobacterales bacterium]